jgi:SsrA-binding protein
VKNGEIFVKGMHISPYEKGNIFNRDPDRDRRLLMHKKEILKLGQRVTQDGAALIPLSVYFNDSRVKVEVGLCKGKKLYDKRETDAKRQADRDMDRAMKNR